MVIWREIEAKEQDNANTACHNVEVIEPSPACGSLRREQASFKNQPLEALNDIVSSPITGPRAAKGMMQKKSAESM
jgi:hypothetical protein